MRRRSVHDLTAAFERREGRCHVGRFAGDGHAGARSLQRLTHCESPSPRVAPLTRKRVFDSVHRERSDPRPTTNTGTLHRSLRTGSRMMPILTVTDLFEGLATNHAVPQRLQSTQGASRFRLRPLHSQRLHYFVGTRQLRQRRRDHLVVPICGVLVLHRRLRCRVR